MQAYDKFRSAHNRNHNSESNDVPPRKSIASALRYHGPSLITLFILVCLSYPGWFSALGLSFDDLTRLNAPQRIFLGWMLRHGQLPLWNPYNFGGQPFLAAGQSGPLYLPNIIYALLPIGAALKVSYGFHVMVAATSMYMIGFRLTKQRLAAIASGIVFVTSGFMLGHQIHTQMFDAMSLVPLAIYFLVRLLDAPTLWNIVGLALAVCFEIYAGHPQVTFYLFIVLFLCTLMVILLTWSQGIIRRLLAVASAGMFALLLSAPQWLTTVKLIPYSDRTHASDQFLLKASLPWSGLLQFLSPFITGGGYTGTQLARTFQAHYGTALFWELTCYAGLTALLLAVTAICSRLFKEPIVAALFLQGIVGILLALGSHGPLKWVLLHAPGFDMFRIPGRYTVLTQLSIAILAAVGIAVLVQAIQKHNKVPLIVLSFTAGLVICVLLYAHYSGPFRIEPTLALVVPILIAVVTVVFAWLLFMIRPRRTFVTGFAFALLVCLDMVVQAAGWSSFVMGSTQTYTTKTGADAFISQHLKPSAPLQKVVALPNTSLAYDESSAFQIKTLNGYDSLEPAWYVNNVNLTWSITGILSQPRTMMDALGVRYLLTTNTVNPLWATQGEGITSVDKWSTVPAGTNALKVTVGEANAPEIPLYGPMLSVTLTSGTHHLTELLTGMPNQQFLIPIPANWPVGEPTHITLQNETWDEQVDISSVHWLSTQRHTSSFISNVWVSPEPWTQVYSDGSETVWENQAATSGSFVTDNPDDPLTSLTGSARPVSFAANQQVWQVTSSSQADFVLGQTFDPGWRATVDGKPVPVMQISGLYGDMLTGVAIPAGKHTVRLTYHPLGFRTGLLLALTGILVIVVLIMLRILNPKNRQRRFH